MERLKKYYVTKAVLKRFEKEYRITIEETSLYKLFMDYIQNDYNVYKVFNKSEVKRLLEIACIFNEELYKKIKIEKREIKEGEDTYRMIFSKGGKPKYHLYKDCEKMSGNYLDFYVPGEFNSLIHPKNLEKFLVENKLTLKGYENRLRNVELFPENKNNRKELEEYEKIIEEYKRTDEDKEYSQKAVEDLRDWFKINEFTKEKFENKEINIGDVINKYNVEIVKKYIGLKKIGSIKDIMIDNSEKEEMSFPNKEQIKEDIDSLIEERKDLLKKNPNLLHRYSKLDWLLEHNEYKDNEKKIKQMLEKNNLFSEPIDKIKHFWEKHLDIKKRLKGVIIACIKNEGNPEKVLYETGFQCCKYCNDRDMIELLNIENLI